MASSFPSNFALKYVLKSNEADELEIKPEDESQDVLPTIKIDSVNGVLFECCSGDDDNDVDNHDVNGCTCVDAGGCRTACRNNFVQQWIHDYTFVSGRRAAVQSQFAAYSTGDARGLGLKTLRAFDTREFVLLCLAQSLPSRTEAMRVEERQQTDWHHNYVLALRMHRHPSGSPHHARHCQTLSTTSTSQCIEFFYDCSVCPFSSRAAELPLSALINHSCAPVLELVPVFVERDQPPYLAFFANQRIAADSELSFDYNAPGLSSLSASSRNVGDADDNSSCATATDIPCLCDASNCRKFLAHHHLN